MFAKFMFWFPQRSLIHNDDVVDIPDQRSLYFFHHATCCISMDLVVHKIFSTAINKKAVGDSFAFCCMLAP